MKKLFFLVCFYFYLSQTNPEIWSSTSSKCCTKSPLPIPQLSDKVITVSTISQLHQTLLNIQNHTTIYLENGIYNLNDLPNINKIEIKSSTNYATNIIIRGLSGNNNDVIIQGNGIHDITNNYGFYSTSISNLIIADLTIKGFYSDNIHIDTYPSPLIGGKYMNNILLHNLHIYDAGDDLIYLQGINNVTVQYCLLETTNGWDVRDGEILCNGDGIVATRVNNLIVKDNAFKNLFCNNHFHTSHTIRIQSNSFNPVIKRNNFVDCAYPIQFYNPESLVEVYKGSIINNFYYRSSNIISTDGVFITSSPHTIIAHNTIYIDTISIKITPIIVKYNNTINVIVSNNLLQKNIIQQTFFIENSNGISLNNLYLTDINWFKNINIGDLHINWNNINIYNKIKSKGVKIDGINYDIDMNLRYDNLVDIGADEYTDICYDKVIPPTQTPTNIPIYLTKNTFYSQANVDNHKGGEIILIIIAALIVSVSVIITCIFCYCVMNVELKKRKEIFENLEILNNNKKIINNDLNNINNNSSNNTSANSSLPNRRPSLYAGVYSDSIPEGFQDIETRRKLSNSCKSDTRKKFYDSSNMDIDTGYNITTNPNCVMIGINTDELLMNAVNTPTIDKKPIDLSLRLITPPLSETDGNISSIISDLRSPTDIDSTEYFANSDAPN